ncbi:MAG TPA: hypothetical protein VFN50_08210 [Acidimicrobiales bacterium]|nr:hypothetical protein [Acidimicrobiales bacterium]
MPRPDRLAVGLAALLLVLANATPAAAARRPHSGGGSAPTGNDVSYPQCASTLPASPAFGIVGVNGGLANDLNACLGPSGSYPSYSQSELYWSASSSVGGTAQPPTSLYVNTADPGNEFGGSAITDWPTSSSSSDPYGTCATTTISTTGGSQTVGADSDACAWQYGYDKAAQDGRWLTAAAQAIDAQSPPVQVASSPATYPWWLDVESANTWQSGTAGDSMNVADLQGMIAALGADGVTIVGVYSTAAQWDQVTGGTTAASGSLYGIPDWIPGARSLSQAESNCALASFTGGTVALTQWSGRLDYDWSC